MDTLLTMDLAITNWVLAYLHNPLLDAILPVFTALGDSGFIWIVLAVLLMIFPKTRRWGMVCALALLIGFLVGEIGIKNLVARARPFTHLPDYALLIPPPDSFSFPSGHSASSFAAATAIWFMDRKYGRWALVLAGIIAFSRVYLAVHFLTDITAGILLGVGSAYLARWLLRNTLPIAH